MSALFPGDSELATLMRAKDWSASALGPVETWPTALRTAVRIVLTSRFSMWMAWGDELVFLYNDSYAADTLRGKHPLALGRSAREVWREIWGDIGPRIEGVLRDGRATWDEALLLMLERDGYPEESYHTFSYSPLHDDDGVVRGMLCVVTENTHRAISERRVAALGALASAIAGDNTEEAVLAGASRSLAAAASDLPFTLTYLVEESGPALVAQTGFAPPFAGDAAAWPIAEVLATGRAIEVPLPPGRWPTGPWDRAPTRVFVAPIARQGQARPGGIFVAGINPHRPFDASYREFITLLVGQIAAGLANARAYEAERRRAESLAALDRAKTVFFSNVSHEFRTPLTLMLGPLADLIADPDVAPTVRAELDTIHRNSLRLLKLVNTMLDFSRIEAGRAHVQLEPVELGTLTADLASVFRAATEKAGLRLVVDCPPLGVPVRVDREMWEKIVLNLLSNAFKFTLAGEIAVALVRRGDDEVELSVRDTGCGIPEGELGHVFERFHRVEGTKGRTHEGTGIGLALVHELVRLHAGRIEVASEVGAGTRFAVTLPIRPADRAAAAAAVSVVEPPIAESNAYLAEALRWIPDHPASAHEAPVGAPRQRVLVADDNADMRAYMKRLLGPRWDVDTAGTGSEALVKIRAHRPDVVITDVMMPELDGFGLVAALRADRQLAQLPVIMVSARAGEEARVEGLQAGATDYLVKPFASRELLARIESLLLGAAVRDVEEAQGRRLAMTFEQAPVAIAILRGPEHVYEVANPHYRRMIAGRDVVGRSVAEALPEVISQGIIDLLDRTFATGEPFLSNGLEVKLTSADGTLEPRVFDFIYQPMFDGDRRVVGIAVIANDVTELATARRAAETANRAKDEFLAMLGHELRNPLAPITTALQLMELRGLVGGERERAVIDRQVKHLVALVDDLLDVSRITRGKIELRSEAVDLADVCARAIEQVSPLLEQQRHALASDVPPGLFVHGDPARLAQVVANLLANAAKYTPRGGRIQIAGERAPGAIVLRVSDNGIGIDPALLRQIFEPFAQSRQAIDRAQGGLGLGLAIVDNLVRLHGGSVVAESDGVGRGSVFTLRLPAIDARATAGGDHVPAAAVTRAVPASAGRVLIVDDNVDAAQLLADLLAASGYETLAAHDGPSALEAVKSFHPQVAVLDLGLPVMDGFELARQLRARFPVGTQLVALTGYGQPQDREKTAAAGFSSHLVKPVDNAQLRALIEKMLR